MKVVSKKETCPQNGNLTNLATLETVIRCTSPDLLNNFNKTVLITVNFHITKNVYNILENIHKFYAPFKKIISTLSLT